MKAEYERMQSVPIMKCIKLLMLFLVSIFISGILLSIEYENNKTIDFFECINILVTGIFP